MKCQLHRQPHAHADGKIHHACVRPPLKTPADRPRHDSDWEGELDGDLIFTPNSPGAQRWMEPV